MDWPTFAPLFIAPSTSHGLEIETLADEKNFYVWRKRIEEESATNSGGLAFSMHSRRFMMTAIYQWHEAYKAALLETDWSKMPERIQAAEAALSQRKRELALDHGGTPEENQAIADAMRGMAVLRDDAASGSLLRALE